MKITLRTTIAAFAMLCTSSIAMIIAGSVDAAQPACNAGTLDTSYGNGGTSILFPYMTAGPNGSNEGMLLDRKDRSVVVIVEPPDAEGNYVLSLLRLNDKGIPDKQFGINGHAAITKVRADGPVFTTTLAEDGAGRILLLVSTNTSFLLLSEINNPAYDGTVTAYRFLENGQLDSTFGSGGAKTIGGLNSIFAIVSVASDAESRVVMSFSAGDPADLSRRIKTTVIRLTANGELDPTFGNGGVTQASLATTGPDRATDIHVQTDGRIVVLGRTHTSPMRRGYINQDWDFYATRFLSDGRLDTSYGTNGATVVDFGSNRANGRKGRLQPDGKLVIAGTVSSTALTVPWLPIEGAFVRLNADGSLDQNFGSSGRVRTSFGLYGGNIVSMDLQADGKIVGSAGANVDSDGTRTVPGVIRLNANGTLDSNYGTNGFAGFLPTGYQWGNSEYVRIDTKGRPVFTLSYGNNPNDANDPGGFMMARLEDGKPGWCR